METKTYKEGAYTIEETGDIAGVREIIIRADFQSGTVKLNPKKGGFEVFICALNKTSWVKVGYRNSKLRAIRLGKEALYGESLRRKEVVS